MIELEPTACPICGPSAPAVELYSSSIDACAFSAETFSARRSPDGRHYRIVRCTRCELLRSDPVVTKDIVQRLYQDSMFRYADETPYLRATYGRQLRRLDAYGVRKDGLLEIGCGNGFFLAEALSQGYLTVRGIEPSVAAVAAAGEIRQHIVTGEFQPGLFPASSFDVITGFQVLDHVRDPMATLQECRRLLRPGGVLLMLHHNADALSARILREHSPIFDVEHLYLYTPRTMRRLLDAVGLQTLYARPVFNRLSLRHLTALLPFRGFLKSKLLRVSSGRVGRVPMILPIGNMVVAARKPL
jgi:SAM-dependent methyltransferase